MLEAKSQSRSTGDTVFNVQGKITSGKMTTEMLRFVKAGQWSSHSHLLLNRWPLGSSVLASQDALAPATISDKE